MAWTGIIDSAAKQAANPVNILVKGRIVNSVSGEVVAFEVFGNDLTDAYLNKVIAAKISAVEARDTALPAITLGTVTVAEPAPEDAARKAFDAALRVYLTAKQVLPFDHPDIGVAQDAMLVLYKPEYIGL